MSKFYQERLGHAEPVHPIAGVPLPPVDMERGCCELGIELPEIAYRLAFVVLRAFFGNHRPSPFSVFLSV